MLHWNVHVEMNKLLCSLSCTWMTILDCLFYAFDSLSWEVSLEDIAKLVVAWLYNTPYYNMYLDTSSWSCGSQKCVFGILQRNDRKMRQKRQQRKKIIVIHRQTRNHIILVKYVTAQDTKAISKSNSSKKHISLVKYVTAQDTQAITKE